MKCELVGPLSTLRCLLCRMRSRTAPCCKITDRPTAEELGPLGRTEFVENSQGLTLCRYLWPVRNPVGVVFCLHGFGSHAGSLLLKRTKPAEHGKFSNSLAELLNGRGYSVACMDMQGCGRSDGFHGRRAYFYEFKDLVRDLREFVHDVRKNAQGFGSDLSTFLFGASMGGCLAVHLAHECGALFTGVALLAPMLSVEQISRSGMNRIYSHISGLLNFLIPDVPLVGMRRIDKFPEIQAFWDQDPAMFKGRIRVRVGYQCVKAIEWIQNHSQQLSFPFIIVHGTEDTLCDPEGSKQFFELSKSTDKTLHMAENMWHLLTAEPGHEKVLETVLQWFDDRSLVNES